MPLPPYYEPPYRIHWSTVIAFLVLIERERVFLIDRLAIALIAPWFHSFFFLTNSVIATSLFGDSSTKFQLQISGEICTFHLCWVFDRHTNEREKCLDGNHIQQGTRGELGISRFTSAIILLCQHKIETRPICSSIIIFDRNIWKMCKLWLSEADFIQCARELIFANNLLISQQCSMNIVRALDFFPVHCLF